MVAQLMFGIGEPAQVKWILAVYYGWFQQPDLLVAVVFTLVLSMMFGFLLGGKWRMISLGFIGLLAITEVHHVIGVISDGDYNPGMITAIPHIALGLCYCARWRANIARIARAQPIRLLWPQSESPS